MLHFILAILFGALVGWIANKLMGKSSGFLMTALLGVIGSLVGNTLYTLLTTRYLDLSFSAKFDFWNVVVSVLGAILASVVYEKMKK